MTPGSDVQTLEVLQHWMMSVVTHSGGVEAGIVSDEAQRACPVAPDAVESVICHSRSQSSIERLAVYSNAYRARLLEVLAGEYPSLVYAVGEDVFFSLAAAYLECHPPRSHTLAELGRKFPDYLAHSRPAREDSAGSADWADFVVDLARLERTYSEVFDGPGIECLPASLSEQLESLTEGQWLKTRLIPAPCLRLMTFEFPVHGYASAARRREQPDCPTAEKTWLAITRRDYVVRRASLDKLEFEILSELVQGGTISSALQHAPIESSNRIDEIAGLVATWFREWSAAGYFVGLQ